MNDKSITIITERGQTSLPASLRREMKLKTGQKLLWEKVSDHELRVIALERQQRPAGPRAMAGHANSGSGFPERSSDQWLSELRAGEEE